MPETQKTVTDWQDANFGQSTPLRYAVRANEEMAELLKALAASNPDSDKAASEIADVVIVLYGAARALGVDLHNEVDKKMHINRARRWGPVVDGHSYHIKESA